LTSKQKRENQLVGSVTVAFRTEKDRRLAISQRLYIAGVSYRVENLLSIPRDQLYRNYNKKGHETSRYTRQPQYDIYSKRTYRTDQHQYNYTGCKTKQGSRYKNYDLVPQ
ncbi:uncharacterized protein K452DRAFT_217345, partial [Aplosporella prunicola CBS 121167]